MTSYEISEILRLPSSDWIAVKASEMRELQKLIQDLQEENEMMRAQLGEWDLNKKGE